MVKRTMTKLFVLWSYSVAIWSNLIVPCVTNPTNWQYCMKDHDQWLYPEIHRAWNLVVGSEVPYQEEQAVLESEKGR